MAQAARCIRDNKEFICGPGHLMRDYCVPDDLWRFIQACMDHVSMNKALDIYSLDPVDKTTLLEFFKNKFGLHYSIMDAVSADPDNYYYLSSYAYTVDYRPRFTSIEGLEKELTALLGLALSD